MENVWKLMETFAGHFVIFRCLKRFACDRQNLRATSKTPFLYFCFLNAAPNNKFHNSRRASLKLLTYHSFCTIFFKSHGHRKPTSVLLCISDENMGKDAPVELDTALKIAGTI